MRELIPIYNEVPGPFPTLPTMPNAVQAMVREAITRFLEQAEYRLPAVPLQNGDTLTITTTHTVS